jgi:hypothetical protein
VTVPPGTTPSAGSDARLLTVVPVHDHTAPTTVNRLRFTVPVLLQTGLSTRRTLPHRGMEQTVVTAPCLPSLTSL